MKKLRRDACVSLQSRCSACLMLRSYVIFRISSVLSVGPLEDGRLWGWVVMVGNACQRLTGSFISTSLSLTRIRPSLYVWRAVMPQFDAQLPPLPVTLLRNLPPLSQRPITNPKSSHTQTHTIQSTTAGMRSDCCECAQYRVLQKMWVNEVHGGDNTDHTVLESKAISSSLPSTSASVSDITS